jgi:hypothetical protein
MTVMFEVYYTRPRDLARETKLTEQVLVLEGRLDFWEESSVGNHVCLTYEFEDWPPAEKAAAILREQGAYVEGPVPYGP